MPLSYPLFIAAYALSMVAGIFAALLLFVGWRDLWWRKALASAKYNLGYVVLLASLPLISRIESAFTSPEEATQEVIYTNWIFSISGNAIRILQDRLDYQILVDFSIVVYVWVFTFILYFTPILLLCLDDRVTIRRYSVAMLLNYAVLPSTPLGGRSWQVLGVVEGTLRPFSKPVALEGGLIEETSDQLVRPGWDSALETDVLNFRVWTGRFFVIVPLAVNWEWGYFRPAYQVAKCRWNVEAERRPAPGQATVKLLPQPVGGAGEPEEVAVTPGSKVEFLGAEGDVVWIQEYLRYRLNGCTHAQSIDKVTQQIEGRGVPPVCK